MLGLFILNSAFEITETVLSQNAGISSESIEWRNDGTETVNAVLAISKVVENRDEDENSGALTVFKALESDLLDEEEDEGEEARQSPRVGHRARRRCEAASGCARVRADGAQSADAAAGGEAHRHRVGAAP